MHDTCFPLFQCRIDFLHYINFKIEFKEFCEVMWNNAFKYEEDEEKGYPILLDEEVDIESLEDAGLFHTYDAINIQVEFPEQCDFITGDEDECSNIDE